LVFLLFSWIHSFSVQYFTHIHTREQTLRFVKCSFKWRTVWSFVPAWRKRQEVEIKMLLSAKPLYFIMLQTELKIFSNISFQTSFHEIVFGAFSKEIKFIVFTISSCLTSFRTLLLICFKQYFSLLFVVCNNKMPAEKPYYYYEMYILSLNLNFVFYLIHLDARVWDTRRYFTLASTAAQPETAERASDWLNNATTKFCTNNNKNHNKLLCTTTVNGK